MRKSLPYIPDKCELVTKSDTEYLPKTIHAFAVETDGFIKFIAFDSADPVTVKVAAGVQYTVSVKQVFSTGTTCGDVWGFR